MGWVSIDPGYGYLGDDSGGTWEAGDYAMMMFGQWLWEGLLDCFGLWWVGWGL